MAEVADLGRERNGPDARPELFIGLVGAVGTDMDEASKRIETALERVRYEYKEVRLIELLHGFDKWQSMPHRFEDERITRHMDAGNEFRQLTERDDALAVLAMVDVQERLRRRTAQSRDPYRPVPDWAYIFRSLKHPGEVRTLRKTYGQSFVLLAVYSPRDKRVQNLMEGIARSRRSAHRDRYRGVAEALNLRDEAEPGITYGQNVRDTFAMADAFIQVGSQESTQKAVDRVIELMFGYPYHTPSSEEYGMFHAQAASLRSASLARQVGAAISTDDGEIMALGTNDVPKSGGGLYWPNDESDHRDFRLGYDTSDETRRQALDEVMERLADAGWLKKAREDMDFEARTQAALEFMTETQLMKAIEYSRCVHAEMSALLHAARYGVRVSACTLYTTTFPCHDCTKHIVAAGISRVVYIEPYAKSLASEFHGDAIAVDEPQANGRVSFAPFVGVGPRLYMDLFAAGKRKDAGGKTIGWSAKGARLRRHADPAVYMRNETDAVALLLGRLQQKGLEFAA